MGLNRNDCIWGLFLSNTRKGRYSLTSGSEEKMAGEKGSITNSLILEYRMKRRSLYFIEKKQWKNLK